MQCRARWPAAVQKFQFKNENSWFDYNSSDFVEEIDDKTFYGISLKKKKNVKGADPTIINKAYSTFIDGPAFTKQRDKLNEIRQEYFPNVVRNEPEPANGLKILRSFNSFPFSRMARVN